VGLRDIILASACIFPVACSGQEPIQKQQAAVQEESALVKALRRAEQFYSEKKYDEAEEIAVEMQESIERDLLLAKIYTDRNSIPTPDKKKFDRKEAIPLWERVLGAGEKYKKFEDRLIDCYETVGGHMFDAAQLLWSYELNPDAKEAAAKLGIQNLEQARLVAKKLYKEARDNLERVIAARPENAMAWHAKGISHARFGEWDEAIIAYRAFASLEPEKPDGYKGLAVMYYSKKQFGSVIDELDLLKNVKAETKRAMFADAVVSVIEDLRAAKKAPIFNSATREDSRKIAELFYLVSEVQWSKELKKDNVFDRNFIQPMYTLFMAATTEYALAETDDERESALQRFDKLYNSLNSGMNNELGRADRTYNRIVIENKRIAVPGTDKFYEALKTKYKK
jgi:hypothetical protein